MNKTRFFDHVFQLLAVILLIGMLGICLSEHENIMNGSLNTGSVLELYSAVILMIMLISCMIEHKKNIQINHTFIQVIVYQIILLLCDAMKDLYVHTKVLIILSYSVLYIVIALFTRYIMEYMSTKMTVENHFCRIIYVICAVMAIIWLLSLNSDYLIYIDQRAGYHYGDYYWISQTAGVGLLLADMGYLLWHRRVLGRHDTVVFFMYFFLPLMMVPLELLWNATPVYLTVSISLYVIYTGIHVEQSEKVLEQEKKLMQQEMELKDSEIRIAISQIQPHFLYNVLTSIAQLCGKEPHKAKAATINFAEYLRRNMAVFNESRMIPFSEELEHVKHYTALEKMRFEEELNVQYDIEETEFYLPVLTLQPLVENAIKWGIGGKEDGGSVKILTRRNADCVMIQVIDDGNGFDIEKINRENINKGRTHLGIENVRARLEIKCGGRLYVESVIGEGTTVTVEIPCEKENEEE